LLWEMTGRVNSTFSRVIAKLYIFHEQKEFPPP
jgi:hypothetical protein